MLRIPDELKCHSRIHLNHTFNTYRTFDYVILNTCACGYIVAYTALTSPTYAIRIVCAQSNYQSIKCNIYGAANHTYGFYLPPMKTFRPKTAMKKICRILPCACM